MSDAGWPEGTPQWWWKYVFPVEKTFWLAILNARFQVADPTPEPWLDGVTAEILEGVAMLQGMAAVEDEAEGRRLKREAIDKINRAVQSIGA